MKPPRHVYVIPRNNVPEPSQYRQIPVRTSYILVYSTRYLFIYFPIVSAESYKMTHIFMFSVALP